MTEVKGQYFFDIIIDEKPIAATSSHIVDMIVSENVLQFLPVYRLRMKDSSGGSFDQQPIYDGCPVKVTMGVDSQQSTDAQEINLRASGVPKIEAGKTEPIFKSIGYLNYPKYLFKVPNESLGFVHSSQAITSIAEKCGLNPIVDNTSDQQRWISMQKSYGRWASYIQDHGYINDSSCMVLCVRSNGDLLYKNLTQIIQGQPKVTLYFGQKPETQNDVFEVLEYDITSNAGTSNLMSGYGLRVTQERLDGSFDEHSNVNATRLSNHMEINREIKDSVENARTIPAVIDSGNTHPNYIKAFHQNKRIKQTFSNHVSLMVDRDTNLQLLDLVEFQGISFGSYEVNPTYSGVYVVTAKTRVIGVNNRYFEKLLLSSTGRNNDPSGAVM